MSEGKSKRDEYHDFKRTQMAKKLKNSKDITERNNEIYKKKNAMLENLTGDDLKEFNRWSWNPYRWSRRTWIWILLLTIVILGSIIGILSWQYDERMKYIKKLENNQRKYSDWPDKKDKAFSIKHQELDQCLQPGNGTNDGFLVLNSGCDEDHIRFKIDNERIKQYKSKSGDVKCLISSGVDKKIRYSNDCSSKDGQILYDDNKIKIKNNEYEEEVCYIVGTDNVVKLGNCSDATKFDLI